PLSDLESVRGGLNVHMPVFFGHRLQDDLRMIRQQSVARTFSSAQGIARERLGPAVDNRTALDRQAYDRDANRKRAMGGIRRTDAGPVHVVEHVSAPND